MFQWSSFIDKSCVGPIGLSPADPLSKILILLSVPWLFYLILLSRISSPRFLFWHGSWALLKGWVQWDVRDSKLPRDNYAFKGVGHSCLQKLWIRPWSQIWKEDPYYTRSAVAASELCTVFCSWMLMFWTLRLLLRLPRLPSSRKKKS